MTALKRSAAILFVAALIVPAMSGTASAKKTTRSINLGSLTTLIQSLTKSSGTTTASNPLAGLNLSGLDLGNLNLGNIKGLDLSKLKGLDLSKLTKGLDLKSLVKSADLQKLTKGIDVQKILKGIDLQKILKGAGLSGTTVDWSNVLSGVTGGAAGQADLVGIIRNLLAGSGVKL